MNLLRRRIFTQAYPVEVPDPDPEPEPEPAIDWSKVSVYGKFAYPYPTNITLDFIVNSNYSFLGTVNAMRTLPNGNKECFIVN